MDQRKRRWSPQRHPYTLKLAESEIYVKVVNVPMETISNSAVEMDGYELYGYERGGSTIMVKRIETDDEGNGHAKPLEHVSQGPDRKGT